MYECKILVENENDIVLAINDLKKAGCNSLVIYLANFGPEGPETILAKRFSGPSMFIAAAEDSDLIEGRGDAFCGMLNCSYNLDLRNIRAFIPEKPVGLPNELNLAIQEFRNIARAVIGLTNLKIITFGPRPSDFFSCNAPIKPLYDLGVEIEENSELDLLISFRNHEKDPRIETIVKEMKLELGKDSLYTDLLPRLAQYELTLVDWAQTHKGSSKFIAFAGKCWPAFQTEFGFVPCYVNSRLTARGIPVSCEVDVYGALSEFIGVCLSEKSVTLLDINNTVPESVFKSPEFKKSNLFMGFHCGNTPACMVKKPHLAHQMIMKRCLEPDTEIPNITRGTLEGNIKPGNVTLYRLQGTSNGALKSYIAQGEVLDADCKSFGGIGLFHINQMERFYRNVLIEKHFPHHGAVMFGHFGKLLFSLFRFLGIDTIEYNRPEGNLYIDENPFL